MARSALAWYDIGAVLSLDRLPRGHPAVRKVTTSAGTYLLKPAWRRTDLALLAELQALRPHGVRQPEIIRTRSGQLAGPQGYFLQEFLAGALELQPSGAQVRAVMQAVGTLHAALAELSVNYEPDGESVFVQVTDPAFLIAELPGLVRHYGLATRPTGTAIACLAEHQAALSALPRQLVHGDIGPDNVLLDGEQVVAIIDFTPHVLPVLFAASTALYWYHVYGRPAVSAVGLAASRAAWRRRGRGPRPRKSCGRLAWCGKACAGSPPHWSWPGALTSLPGVLPEPAWRRLRPSCPHPASGVRPLAKGK